MNKIIHLIKLCFNPYYQLKITIKLIASKLINNETAKHYVPTLRTFKNTTKNNYMVSLDKVDVGMYKWVNDL